MGSMLQVVSYTSTRSNIYDTILANSSYLQDLVIPYDILLVYDQFPTLGLSENMVYDMIPAVASATGNVAVNASTYDVDCGVLQDLQVVPVATSRDPACAMDNTTTAPNYVLQASFEGCGDLRMAIPLPYFPAVYTGTAAPVPTNASTNGTCDVPYFPIIVASTIPIVDSDLRTAAYCDCVALHTDRTANYGGRRRRSGRVRRHDWSSSLGLQRAC